jgi:hypothetical protein
MRGSAHIFIGLIARSDARFVVVQNHVHAKIISQVMVGRAELPEIALLLSVA